MLLGEPGKQLCTPGAWLLPAPSQPTPGASRGCCCCCRRRPRLGTAKSQEEVPPSAPSPSGPVPGSRLSPREVPRARAAWDLCAPPSHQVGYAWVPRHRAVGRWQRPWHVRQAGTLPPPPRGFPNLFWVYWDLLILVTQCPGLRAASKPTWDRVLGDSSSWASGHQERLRAPCWARRPPGPPRGSQAARCRHCIPGHRGSLGPGSQVQAGRPVSGKGARGRDQAAV